ncbi:MAG: HD domain-containing protein [Firmicutes bacterium]|nr:HD domain-containing protein [Bacillota bacterium]
MDFFVPPQLNNLCALLSRPLYIVGGFVRNQICSLPLKMCDIDIAGDFCADEFKKTGAKVLPINKKLGTAQIHFQDAVFEYTQFRTEEYDGTGSHSPIRTEFVSSLEIDAKRRDFCANSIYFDIKNNKIVDPLGGVSDTKNKVLKAFDPYLVFKNDGLRLMRLVRFASELGFEIEQKTFETAKDYCINLKDISPERKRDELDKILISDQKYGIEDAHFKGVNLLHGLNLYDFFLPSIPKMEIGQNPTYHKYNVLIHTFYAVKYAPPIPNIRLAALMHDTGKPVCKQLNGNMNGHAETSAQIAINELGQNGLKYPNATVGQVAMLCRLHMYDLKGDVSDSKMKIFVATHFELIDKLQQLKTADALATGFPLKFVPRFKAFKDQLIKENAPIYLKSLKVNGHDAIKAGFKNQQIALVLTQLWKMCLIDPKLNNRKWLLAQLESRARLQ